MGRRKSRRKAGVTAQRGTGRAVRAAIESGALAGSETLKAKVRLSIEGLDLDHEIVGDIALS